ncbi:MAG TPA: membrane protein insertion efficiency factor YidD [Acidobacteriaceae bacterium]|nr:membrane protein insertion efficiency factor YidD [Acidobacteriaceae bacterium]
MSPPTSTVHPGPQSNSHRLLALAFRFYKAALSPMLHAVAPSRCLYLPTCSEYAYIAIRRFGLRRGSWLALKRFARCQPWGKGGLDPVPQRPASSVPQSSSGSNPADHLP